jgi:transposase
MSYIRGEDRGQATFLPPRLDDYVRDDAPVRVIDAFVDHLDFARLGFARAVPAETGRPGYDPRDLLKLYVYGYLNEVRSSRKLERECGRNVEAMWLVRCLAPDFKTIADFRRDSAGAIVAACRAFVLFCREQGLFAARLVALDGSKFQAAASPKRIMGRREIAEEDARLERRIAAYLGELDTSDGVEADEIEDGGRTTAALAALKARRISLAAMRESLDKAGRNTLVEGEPDARLMGIGRQRKIPSYNVQTAVDTETSLILHHAVTDEPTDNRLLFPMAEAAKTIVGTRTLRVVADAGYSSGDAAARCEAAGIEPCVPVNRSGNSHGDFFDRSAFAYDRPTDTYRCPAGQTLTLHSRSLRDSLYLYKTDACPACRLKPQCTKAEGRWVSRHFHEDALDRMNQRVAADPGLMRIRRTTAEHPFGTIKRMTAGGRFLTRGIEKVRAEAALSVLAYNLLRAANLIGGARLAARLA